MARVGLTYWHQHGRPALRLGYGNIGDLWSCVCTYLYPVIRDLYPVIRDHLSFLITFFQSVAANLHLNLSLTLILISYGWHHVLRPSTTFGNILNSCDVLRYNNRDGLDANSGVRARNLSKHTSPKSQSQHRVVIPLRMSMDSR